MAAWAEGVEQILLEERSSPTVRYDGTNNATKVALAFSSPSASPQRVQEDTRAYEFKSVNYQLLSSLSAQFDEKENAGIRLHLMRRMSDVNAIKKNWSTAYPSWNDYTSELPLVAELLIRTGHSVDLFLHALFVLQVVLGALLTRFRPVLRWLHIASLVWGILYGGSSVAIH